MAIIKPKHGTTAPSTGLAQYELAVDTTNKRVYIGNAGGGGDLVGSAPGGSDTQVQFNDAGNLGGDSGLTYNKTSDTLTAGNVSTTGLEVKTVGGDEGGQIDFQLPATNTTLLTGVAIDVFQNRLRIFEKGGTTRGVYIDLTSASSSVGTNLLSGGGGTPGGSDTQVQFNDGSSFGGDSGLTYNKTTDSLTITGDLAVNGGDITTSSATAALFNTTATTIDAFGAASIINIGAASGFSTTINLNNTSSNTITVPENVALTLSSPGTEDGAAITIQGSASSGGATVTISGALVYNGSITGAIWGGSAIGADRGGTGHISYADGDILYAGPSTTTQLSKLAKPTATSFLQMTSAGTPSWVQGTLTPDYLLFDMGIV